VAGYRALEPPSNPLKLGGFKNSVFMAEGIESTRLLHFQHEQ
jgi:hypothetical protein